MFTIIQSHKITNFMHYLTRNPVDFQFFWTNESFERINHHIFCVILKLYFIRLKKMGFALSKIFETENNVSRRGLLKTLGRGMAGAAFAATLASLPISNDAQAGEAKAATPSERPSHMRRDMRHYSENPEVRGIGVFINLQANAPVNGGEQLGEALKRIFSGANIPMEYRVNRSLGTATDLTFYVGGVGYPVGLPDIKRELPQLVTRYKGAWVPGNTALLSPEQR